MHSTSSQSTSQQGLNIVAIGGGTGLSTVLAGLKNYVNNALDDVSATRVETLSAIVTVSDDGGSSGRLRDELRMLPPGDIRNCMVALSEDSALLSRLFQYRFPGDGALGGHSFGNLFLAALTSVTGDFAEAVRVSSEVLASKGRIFPATLDDVRLVATLADGTTLRGESVIGRSHAPIRELQLEPEICQPLPETLAAIAAADIITIGPGSLYTSLLPNLLVERVARCIKESPAIKIFVCNLMTQPGETDGFTARAHLAAVHEYAPELVFDFVLVNNALITPEQTARYLTEGAQQVVAGDELQNALVQDAGRTRIVAVNLLDGEAKVRHSPPKLARAILDCHKHCHEHRDNQTQTFPVLSSNDAETLFALPSQQT